MKRCISHSFLAAIFLLLPACSIRPLPEHVTGYSTYDIVQKVRCEIRDSVKGYTIAFIARYNKEVAEKLSTGELSFKEFNKRWRKRMPKEAQKILDRYDDSAVAYDFTLDITETNKANADIDFVQAVTRGTLGLGIKGSGQLDRQNRRNFHIADNFQDLLVVVPDRYCTQTDNGPNIVYPITGNLNLVELVGTFFDLNQSAHLGTKDGKLKDIADTIEFTTKYTGSINPKLELKPVGKSFELASIGGGVEAERQDLHKVVIAISLPAEERAKGKKPTKATRRESSVARALSELGRQQTRELIDTQKVIQKKVEELVP